MATDLSGDYFERYARVARPRYASKDPAHDWTHIERIWSRVPWLSEEFEVIDPDRLAFLTAFHGLASVVGSDEAFRREVRQCLTDAGRSREQIDELLVALDRHTTAPATPEEVVVHDANALEVIGAFGIAKTFTKGGAEGQSYEETIAHYRGFLDAVQFHTNAARSIEAERRTYAEQFLARFAVEDEPPLR